MLAKFKISSRLMLMVVLSVLGIASVAGVGLSALKSSLLEDRKRQASAARPAGEAGA
ncbi:Tfp pilus assembly protein PilX [Bradyrhizobium sp. GM22.5]